MFRGGVGLGARRARGSPRDAPQRAREPSPSSRGGTGRWRDRRGAGRRPRLAGPRLAWFRDLAGAYRRRVVGPAAAHERRQLRELVVVQVAGEVRHRQRRGRGGGGRRGRAAQDHRDQARRIGGVHAPRRGAAHEVRVGRVDVAVRDRRAGRIRHRRIQARAVGPDPAARRGRELRLGVVADPRPPVRLMLVESIVPMPLAIGRPPVQGWRPVTPWRAMQSPARARQAPCPTSAAGAGDRARPPMPVRSSLPRLRPIRRGSARQSCASSEIA